MEIKPLFFKCLNTVSPSLTNGQGKKIFSPQKEIKTLHGRPQNVLFTPETGMESSISEVYDSEFCIIFHQADDVSGMHELGSD